MVHAGMWSDRTGICTAGTITTTVFMDELNGAGDGTGVLESICIVSAPCTATTRVIGAGSAPTGTCGVATTTTKLLVGSGDDIAALATICTDTGFLNGGQVQDG